MGIPPISVQASPLMGEYGFCADDLRPRHLARGAPAEIGDAGQYVGEVMLRVDGVELGGLDQGINRCGAAGRGSKGEADGDF